MTMDAASYNFAAITYQYRGKIKTHPIRPAEYDKRVCKTTYIP